MSKKFLSGIVFLALGSASFTWFLLLMKTNYPAAFFGMISSAGSFSFTYAPPWLWGALALSLLSVIKGARNIGKGVKGE